MQENPLKTMEKLDPALMKLVEESRQLAFREGALPRKIKLVIAMTLLAANGADDGVRSLARVAMQAGATKEEILEALRVVQYVGGVNGAFTAYLGIQELF